MLAVAGVSPPPSERLILQVAPKTAGRLSASVIQVSLGVCRGGRKQKPGSECGIRLDQSQEPLAGTVSDTTGTAQRFQRRGRTGVELH